MRGCLCLCEHLGVRSWLLTVLVLLPESTVLLAWCPIHSISSHTLQAQTSFATEAELSSSIRPFPGSTSNSSHTTTSAVSQGSQGDKQGVMGGTSSNAPGLVHRRREAAGQSESERHEGAQEQQSSGGVKAE